MAELVIDPVCKMEIDPETAAGKSEHEGTTYYFCADGCKQTFDSEPAKYLANGDAPTSAPTAERPAEASAAQEPVEAAAASSDKRWWEFWKS